MERGIFVVPDQIREQIEVEQYDIHLAYHEKLLSFVEPNNLALIGAMTHIMGPIPPSKPKRKHALQNMICEYAKALLVVELKYLPATNKDTEEYLCHRVENVVIERANVAGGIMQDIKYHASELELRVAIQTTLPSFIESKRVIIGSQRAKTPESLSDKIRALRIEAGVSAAGLGKLVGITGKSVYRNESGKSAIRAKNLKEYSRVFTELLERPIQLQNVPSALSKRPKGITQRPK